MQWAGKRSSNYSDIKRLGLLMPGETLKLTLLHYQLGEIPQQFLHTYHLAMFSTNLPSGFHFRSSMPQALPGTDAKRKEKD